MGYAQAFQIFEVDLTRARNMEPLVISGEYNTLTIRQIPSDADLRIRFNEQHYPEIRVVRPDMPRFETLDIPFNSCWISNDAYVGTGNPIVEIVASYSMDTVLGRPQTTPGTLPPGLRARLSSEGEAIRVTETVGLRLGELDNTGGRLNVDIVDRVGRVIGEADISDDMTRELGIVAKADSYQYVGDIDGAVGDDDVSDDIEIPGNASVITLSGSVDAATTLTLEVSRDGTNWYRSHVDELVLSGAGGYVHTLTTAARYIRLHSTDAVSLIGHLEVK